MSTETWIRVGALIAGLALIAVGGYDAFGNHAATFGATTDLALVVGGAGVIAGKAIFDAGVAVPTPPKV